MLRKIITAVFIVGLTLSGVSFIANNRQISYQSPVSTPASTPVVSLDGQTSQAAQADRSPTSNYSQKQAVEYEPQAEGSAKPKTIKIRTTDGYIERPNIRYQALYAPNDLRPTQWYTNKIGAPATWNKTTGSDSTTVAVIDTGFALSHDELSYRWALNASEQGATSQEGTAPNCTSRGITLDKSCNNIDDDSNGYIDDWRGWDFDSGDNDPQAGKLAPTDSAVSHGTMVSGLVGAAGNNNIGAASLNWQTKLLPLQALDDTGTGYTSTIAQAIRYAVDRGADVISMSLGTDQPDEVLQIELQYAADHNVTVVAAAGNDGCDCLSYPANYPEVIAVGATDSTDAVTSFSSYGANLDVSAPGAGSLYTTTWTATNGQSGYTSGSIYGTSFAAPIVGGLAALLKGVRPDATPAMITSWIKTGADPVVSGNGGQGRINAYNSLLLASPEIVDSLPSRTTPIYKMTKTNKDPLYTSSYDRKENLRLLQGYNYSIMRFADY